MYFSIVLDRKNDYYSEFLGETIVDLMSNTFTIPDDFQADVLAMEDGFEGRSDLVSDQAYMDEMHMDVICKLNGVSNPFEMNNDSMVVLPKYEHMYDFVQYPSDKWKEDPKKEKSVPRPLTKSEKRKPNQAVIGDPRFNIDPSSKIVVY